MMPGAEVFVSAPTGDAVHATIVELITPDQLPAIAGKDLSAVLEVLSKWGVTRLALMGRHRGADVLGLVAIEIEGAWFDLERRPLTIVSAQSVSPLPS